MGIAIVAVLSGCGSTGTALEQAPEEAAAALVAQASRTPVIGDGAEFVGSSFPEIGLAGLFASRSPEGCEVAVLAGGEDSFALRMQSLRDARHSIRIQALIFQGDESGLRIAELLKEKKQEGLDVRVIVDAFSNPWLQSQWMYFDLKQHGIEVEGYEAMALQWINEVPVPFLTPHFDPARPDKRFHDKMWIVDAETEHAIAVTGGLNIGNPYFRVDPDDPDANWRDQDVVVRGDVVDDLAAAFDRNFEYLVDIKESRGIFNTNLYWGATRSLLDHTGRFPVRYSTDPDRDEYVTRLEARRPDPEFRRASCRFIQSRPRMRETYIHQAYLKLIGRAKREVLIANAYFVPTPSIRLALRQAAQRCVAVRIISNSPETNDLPEISLVGRGHYAELLAVNETPEVEACDGDTAGLRIWEWMGKSASEDVARQGTMHSKYAVIDGVTSLVGSYNLDPRSQRLNSETALVFEQPELAEELRTLFVDNDLRFSVEVTADRAAAFERPERIVERFRKSIGHLFEAEL